MQISPIALKRKELENDPRYRTEAAPDTYKARDQRTAASTQERRSPSVDDFMYKFA